jgi:hypothetical protein
MSWLDSTGFDRRPVVVVEDHLYHTADLVDALARSRPDLVAQTTVCAIDRRGPDTDASVADLLARHPVLQVAARVSARDRVRAIEDGDLSGPTAFARLLHRLLRPGGLLVQDIQLSTLAFIPADRWWESIYTAATVRGMFGDRVPTVRFLSNKRGYAATFGRELIDAGFDPRDVMDKADRDAIVLPAVGSWFDRALPLDLVASGGVPTARCWPVGTSPHDRDEIDARFDVVLWSTPTVLELSGRLVAGADNRIALKRDGHEARTWRDLIVDCLGPGQGLAVVDVGARIGPPDADRAEMTNLAARHAHTLRSRLRDGASLVTREHRYRLADGVTAGIVMVRGT